jgi:hypothetical protein
MNEEKYIRLTIKTPSEFRIVEKFQLGLPMYDDKNNKIGELEAGEYRFGNFYLIFKVDKDKIEKLLDVKRVSMEYKD